MEINPGGRAIPGVCGAERARIGPGGGPCDFFVGFRSDPERGPEGGGRAALDERGSDPACDLVLVCDGVAVDRHHERLPLRADVPVRFTGRAEEGRTEVSVKAEFS